MYLGLVVYIIPVHATITTVFLWPFRSIYDCKSVVPSHLEQYKVIWMTGSISPIVVFLIERARNKSTPTLANRFDQYNWHACQRAYYVIRTANQKGVGRGNIYDWLCGRKPNEILAQSMPYTAMERICWQHLSFHVFSTMSFYQSHAHTRSIPLYAIK